MNQEENIRSEMDRRFNEIISLLATGFHNLDTIFRTFKEEVSARFDRIETRVDRFEKNTTERFEKLDSEISKINQVTRYEEQFKTMQGPM